MDQQYSTPKSPPPNAHGHSFISPGPNVSARKARTVRSSARKKEKAKAIENPGLQSEPEPEPTSPTLKNNLIADVDPRRLPPPLQLDALVPNPTKGRNLANFEEEEYQRTSNAGSTPLPSPIRAKAQGNYPGNYDNDSSPDDLEATPRRRRQPFLVFRSNSPPMVQPPPQSTPSTSQFPETWIRRPTSLADPAPVDLEYLVKEYMSYSGLAASSITETITPGITTGAPKFDPVTGHLQRGERPPTPYHPLYQALIWRTPVNHDQDHQVAKDEPQAESSTAQRRPFTRIALPISQALAKAFFRCNTGDTPTPPTEAFRLVDQINGTQFPDHVKPLADRQLHELVGEILEWHKAGFGKWCLASIGRRVAKVTSADGTSCVEAIEAVVVIECTGKERVGDWRGGLPQGVEQMQDNEDIDDQDIQEGEANDSMAGKMCGSGQEPRKIVRGTPHPIRRQPSHVTVNSESFDDYDSEGEGKEEEEANEQADVPQAYRPSQQHLQQRQSTAPRRESYRTVRLVQPSPLPTPNTANRGRPDGRRISNMREQNVTTISSVRSERATSSIATGAIGGRRTSRPIQPRQPFPLLEQPTPQSRVEQYLSDQRLVSDQQRRLGETQVVEEGMVPGSDGSPHFSPIKVQELCERYAGVNLRLAQGELEQRSRDDSVSSAYINNLYGNSTSPLNPPVITQNQIQPNRNPNPLFPSSQAFPPSTLPSRSGIASDGPAKFNSALVSTLPTGCISPIRGVRIQPQALLPTTPVPSYARGTRAAAIRSTNQSPTKPPAVTPRSVKKPERIDDGGARARQAALRPATTKPQGAQPAAVHPTTTRDRPATSREVVTERTRPRSRIGDRAETGGAERVGRRSRPTSRAGERAPQVQPRPGARSNSRIDTAGRVFERTNSSGTVVMRSGGGSVATRSRSRDVGFGRTYDRYGNKIVYADDAAGSVSGSAQDTTTTRGRARTGLTAPTAASSARRSRPTSRAGQATPRLPAAEVAQRRQPPQKTPIKPARPPFGFGGGGEK